MFRGENAGLGRGGLGSNLLGWVEWKYVSVRVKLYITANTRQSGSGEIGDVRLRTHHNKNSAPC